VAGVVNEFHWRARLGVVVVAPSHQRHQGRGKGPALHGQVVFAAGGPLLVKHFLDHPLVDQGIESVGKKVSGYSEVGLDSGESPHAPEEVSQDQQCPFVADRIERVLDRAVLADVICRHSGTIGGVGLQTQLTSSNRNLAAGRDVD